MKNTGHTDLPLHGGKVPYWLATRMAKLGGAITEAIIEEYGKPAFLSRLSDPFWFQSFGAVLGMDWHSSGITTSVMGALKKAINPISDSLGLYVCGGRGKHSLQTPDELRALANRTGMDGNALIRSSKLSAKVDNTAIQDGYQLYLHSFVVTSAGEWSVIQQGMNNYNGMARRYHWNSTNIKSFVKTPHTAVCGVNKGEILNLTASEASPTTKGILDISLSNDRNLLKEFSRILVMPRHHDVRSGNVDLKRLGSTLALAHDQGVDSFEELLLLKGVGPRTIQSLTLVSEVIHGTPSRFDDPARFSFAHGGKDGHPFPVPTKVYDETIDILGKSVDRAKMGYYDKQRAIQSLHKISSNIEKNFKPKPDNFGDIIQKERDDSHKFGGRTVFGIAKPPNRQLSLFNK